MTEVNEESSMMLSIDPASDQIPYLQMPVLLGLFL